ncbi:MAG: hypothetical protein LC637_05980, partial [Xanthomonadaceae bacterium]|nr:hypothetical protein [Xanthomonadaceae bacterium]
MRFLPLLTVILLLAACGGDRAPDFSSDAGAVAPEVHLEAPETVAGPSPELLIDRRRLSIYRPVELSADLSNLSAGQRQ